MGRQALLVGGQTSGPARARLRAKRGNALIQFTLCLPVLIGLFLGTWKYGYAFYLYAGLSEAARSGARYASLRLYDSATSTPSSAFTTAVQNMAVYGDPTGAATTPVVTGLTTSNVNVEVTFASGAPTAVSVSISGFKLPTFFGTVTLNKNPYVWFPYVGVFGPP